MSWVHNLLMIVQVATALGVIVLVLMQHGKGADMGAAFGSGASGSLFGATGSANFMSRFTAVLATVFFVSTLGLAFITNKPPAQSSVMDGAAIVAPQPAQSSQPSDVPPATGRADGVPAGAPSSGASTQAPSDVPGMAPGAPVGGTAAPADDVPK